MKEQIYCENCRYFRNGGKFRDIRYNSKCRIYTFYQTSGDPINGPRKRKSYLIPERANQFNDCIYYKKALIKSNASLRFFAFISLLTICAFFMALVAVAIIQER